jgi:WD40-like Beta Propeller Repeat
MPQIWFQPYPSGEALRISNDLSDYEYVRSSGDGKSLITIQRRTSSMVYVGDSPASLTRYTKWNLEPVSTEQTAGQKLSWTSSGKLAQIDNWNHFDLTSPTGANRVRLLGNDPTVWELSGCGLGDQLAIRRVRDKDETNIWLFNPATSELRQITSGEFSRNPSCSPDGRWLIHQNFDRLAASLQILKIPTSGGDPVKLASGGVYSSTHAISPDGQRFVYLRYEGDLKQRKMMFVVQKLEGDSPKQTIEAGSGAHNVGWTPDGTALTFLRDEDDGTSSLWIQPLSGGPPKRTLHFDSEPSRIIEYAWSLAQNRHHTRCPL